MLLHAQDDGEIWYYINQAMEPSRLTATWMMRSLYQGPLGNLPPYVMAQGVILLARRLQHLVRRGLPDRPDSAPDPGYYLESRLTLTV